MAYIIIISRSIIRTAYIIHIASHHSSVYRAFVGNRRTVPPIPLQNSCAILICVVECILFAGHPICVYRICTTHEAEDKMCLVRKFDTRTFCAEKLKCNAQRTHFFLPPLARATDHFCKTPIHTYYVQQQTTHTEKTTANIITKFAERTSARFYFCCCCGICIPFASLTRHWNTFI